MRRLFALCALLIAAPSFGAALIRPQAAPVQLTLPFGAPAAAMPLAAPPLAASPSALPAAPILPSAAPALSARVPAAPQPMAVAPAPHKDEGADGRSQLQTLARDGDDADRAFDAPRRTTKMDYEEFGRQLARRPGLDENPFRHADEKRRMLAASGYTHLFGAGGRRIPLAEAADVRVGKAFLSVKKTFDRRR